jgi:hypothetical protein
MSRRVAADEAELGAALAGDPEAFRRLTEQQKRPKASRKIVFDRRELPARAAPALLPAARVVPRRGGWRDGVQETLLRAYRWRATLVIGLGLLMAILDVTIVSVVLPQIATALHAEYGTSTWIGTGYLLANAAVIPIVG